MARLNRLVAGGIRSKACCVGCGRGAAAADQRFAAALDRLYAGLNRLIPPRSLSPPPPLHLQHLPVT